MSQDKIYCGNGKVIKTQYGELMRLSFSKEDIEKLSEQSNGSDSGWVNVTVKQRREPSAGGMTHYLEVDTWKPENSGNTAAPAANSNEEELTAEDLPF
ncbi:hypothetical protein CSB37_01560 [bacterium DOLZORAL124_38_8]|nr:MAG: hypothetical protein CSB37_01560 [bacterium DOLZORAL124_38_8]